MSRKTRKLIWSVPLVAVLAVAGALAIFATLAPGAVCAERPARHTDRPEGGGRWARSRSR